MPDTTPVRWQPDRHSGLAAVAAPSLPTALRRGTAGRCPACGNGKLFSGWLAVQPVCAHCAVPLGNIRADDAPPYFTVFIVAHVAIGALIAFESVASLSVPAELAIFLPGTLALTLLLIRPVKGATVGLMWKLGFARPTDEIGHG